jgi:hypothetical protein
LGGTDIDEKIWTLCISFIVVIAGCSSGLGAYLELFLFLVFHGCSFNSMAFISRVF